MTQEMDPLRETDQCHSSSGGTGDTVMTQEMDPLTETDHTLHQAELVAVMTQEMDPLTETEHSHQVELEALS